MAPPALEEAQQAELKAAVQELPAEAGIGFRLCLIQKPVPQSLLTPPVETAGHCGRCCFPAAG